MGRTCSIRACSTGTYKNRIERNTLGLCPITVFSIPKRNNILQKWSEAIGQKLLATDVICELHFNKDSVIKEDKTLLKDGTVHVLPRVKPKLAQDALPIAITDKENVKLVSQGENIESKEVAIPHQSPVSTEWRPDVLALVVNSKSLCETADKSMDSTSLVDPLIISLELNMDTQKALDDGFNVDDKAVNNNDAFARNQTENFKVPFTIDDVFRNLKTKIVLPEGWSWSTNYQKKNSIFFSQVDGYTQSQRLRLVLHNDLSITAHTPDGKVQIELESTITSVESLEHLFYEMKKQVICCGTGMDKESRDESCPGFIPPDKYKKHLSTPRCAACQKLRNKIRDHCKRNTDLESRYEEARKRLNDIQRSRGRLRKKVRELVQNQNHRHLSEELPVEIQKFSRGWKQWKSKQF